MRDPVLSVACRTCGTEVWRGGQMDTTDTVVRGLPFTDGQAVLTEFADVSCPQGGVGCPHTTAARTKADDERPVTRRELRDVRTQLDEVDRRTKPRP